MSNELKARIEEEAKEKYPRSDDATVNGNQRARQAYIAGATPYAERVEELEELKEWFERFEE